MKSAHFRVRKVRLDHMTPPWSLPVLPFLWFRECKKWIFPPAGCSGLQVRHGRYMPLGHRSEWHFWHVPDHRISCLANYCDCWSGSIEWLQPPRLPFGVLLWGLWLSKCSLQGSLCIHFLESPKSFLDTGLW